MCEIYAALHKSSVIFVYTPPTQFYPFPHVPTYIYTVIFMQLMRVSGWFLAGDINEPTLTNSTVSIQPTGEILMVCGRAPFVCMCCRRDVLI